MPEGLGIVLLSLLIGFHGFTLTVMIFNAADFLIVLMSFAE